MELEEMALAVKQYKLPVKQATSLAGQPNKIMCWCCG
jgi:hypothetical protein